MTSQQSARQSQSDTAPWYRHRWPWILMSVPAFSIVLGVILIGTAMRNPAILVVDNYYAEGRGINRSMEMDNMATTLGLQARMTYNNNDITVTLNPRHENASYEEALRLHVYHATDDLRDQSFLLLPTDVDGTYEPADSDSLTDMINIMNSQGAWYLDLRGADDSWRLRKRITTPVTEVAL